MTLWMLHYCRYFRSRWESFYCKFPSTSNNNHIISRQCKEMLPVCTRISCLIPCPSNIETFQEQNRTWLFDNVSLTFTSPSIWMICMFLRWQLTTLIVMIIILWSQLYGRANLLFRFTIRSDDILQWWLGWGVVGARARPQESPCPSPSHPPPKSTPVLVVDFYKDLKALYTIDRIEQHKCSQIHT